MFCPSLWTTHLFVAEIEIRTITAQITDLEKEVNDEKELFGGEERRIICDYSKKGHIHAHKMLLEGQKATA